MGPRLARARILAFGAAAAAVAVTLALGAQAASAAKLVGGPSQAALSRAFLKPPAHRGQVIVSTRVSTVVPGWAVVESVTPEPASRTTASARPPQIRATFYHLVHGAARAAPPPPKARADLTARFSVAVVYSGSGSETVAYNQPYASVCLGQGGFTDTQTDTVKPMTWTVRYIVHPDELQAALRSSAGVTLTPTVTFASASSSLSATETLARTVVDVGCAGRETNFSCTENFGLRRSGSPLAFLPSGGIEVGFATSATRVGACDPSDYTLGPALWDSGAIAARVPTLGLIGGTLPRNPYTPVTVTWPAQAAATSDGFVTSPCQGDGAACTDTFAWSGTVSLVADSPG